MTLRNIAIIFLFTVGLASCTRDACKDVTCLNGGTCQDGDCVCTAGYEGPNCSTEQRLAFVGNYSVQENCNLGTFNYTISINADSEAGTELTLHNLGDFNFDITGVVNGTTVTFTDQTGNGATINGTGQLTGGTLVISYTLVPGSGPTLSCTMNCTIIE
ncbi:MAG: calcium-binding EGF-like domain-containing protein [Flavobacteriales bacterium]|nr:calcium-binding EGF-like domain-containing protein [Flavobacteriales bacterium]